MKAILTTLIFLVCYYTIDAQEVVLNDSTGTYRAVGVVQIDSTDKKTLYSSAMAWVALGYKSSKDVIQLSDMESGRIIIKGAFKTNIYMKSGFIYHTLTLEFKDNRYRYTYSDLSYYSSGSGEMSFDKGGMISKGTAVKSAQSSMQKAIDSLTEYLISKKAISDDW